MQYISSKVPSRERLQNNFTGNVDGKLFRHCHDEPSLVISRQCSYFLDWGGVGNVEDFIDDWCRSERLLDVKLSWGNKHGQHEWLSWSSRQKLTSKLTWRLGWQHSLPFQSSYEAWRPSSVVLQDSLPREAIPSQNWDRSSLYMERLLLLSCPSVLYVLLLDILRDKRVSDTKRKTRDSRLHSRAGGGLNMCHKGFGQTSHVVGIW